MKLYLFIIFAVIFSVTQASFLSGFFFFGASPNLVLSGLLTMILLRKKKGAVYYAIIAGVLLDVYNATLFGLNALIFLLIYFLVFLLLDTVFTESGSMTTFFLATSSTIFFHALTILLSLLTKLIGFTNLTPVMTFSKIGFIFLSSLFNVLIVFLLFYFFRFIDEFFEKKAFRRRISF